MRLAVLFAVAGWALAQSPDRAYEALRAKDYDAAVPLFLKAIENEPRRASLRLDLAYTYLKIGENELARTQFREAMVLQPADPQAALEYAFLCNETGQPAEARRIFDRLRRTGNITAEQAFRNIDEPLAAGIDRWRKAIAMGSDTFSSHYELASLAEQRDELALAAEHFERAWRLLPSRRSVLVDLGRVWKAMHREESASAALLAASRGGEARAAEMARGLLPDRYPYVGEFRGALELDPANVELRRELAYLLLRMERQAEAEIEFRYLVNAAPEDLLSATQLGFLLYARGERAAAQPLFDRVLAGSDEDLANRVRAVLRLPQLLRSRPAERSVDAREMAERSLKAGYLKDALKYLQIAHEADPGDFPVMLKLGWTYNVLHQDSVAIHWFDLARKSPDIRIASEADQAWRRLRPALQPVRTSVWLYPLFSYRFQDLFGYAQAKTEIRTGLPLVPYASVRLVGDTAHQPGYGLSEKSVILALGVRTPPWHRVTFWGEAGWTLSYDTGHALPDYRGGFSVARGVGPSLWNERGGWFADTALDGIFVSRFGNDFLWYSQSRSGYTAGPKAFRAQLYGIGNLTVDVLRQPWANIVETGLGIRWRQEFLPQSMYLTCNLLRGKYLMHGASFNDLRAGAWYAFSY